MKKLLALLLLLTLLISAAHAEGMRESITLIVKAEELARELDALAEDDAYISAFTDDADVRALAAEWGAGSHDAPARVLMVNLVDFEIMLMRNVPENLPEAGLLMLVRRLPGLLVQTAVNAGGVNVVSASAIVRKEITFASPVEHDTGLFLLLYEDAAPVAVSWFAEEGAVSMSAVFLPDVTVQEDTVLLGDMAIPCAEADGWIDDGLVPENAQPTPNRALALAGELRGLAGNDAWLEVSGLADPTRALLADYAGTEGMPRLLLEMTRFSFFDSPELPDALSELQRETVLQRLTSSALTAIVARASGAEALAAMASIQAADIFADEAAEGSGMYILLYEDGAPIVVQWAAGEDAVSMNASFLPDEGLMNCRTAWEVEKWAEQYGLLLLVNTVPDETAAFPADMVDRLAQLACVNWPAVCMDADLAYANTLAMLEGCTYLQPTMTVPLEYVPTVLEGAAAEAWETFMSGETMLMTSSGAKSWDELVVEPAPSSASAIRIGVVNHIGRRIGSTSYLAEVTLTCNDPTLPDMSGGAFHFYADGAPLLAVWDVRDGEVELTVRPIPDERLAACDTPADVQAWIEAEECQVHVIE